MRVLEIQEENLLLERKNIKALNARYALEYKQKAEEMDIPDEEIMAKYMEFQL